MGFIIAGEFIMIKNIIVAIFIFSFASFGANKLALFRTITSGHLDLTFGKMGAVSANFPKHTLINIAGVAVDVNNKTVVGGTICEEPQKIYKFFVIRYLEDGSLDPSFGENGKMIMQFAESTKVMANDLKIDTENTVIAGHSFGEREGLIVAFFQGKSGKNGRMFIELPEVRNEKATTIAFPKFNKILLSGSATILEKEQFLLVQINGDGTLDNDFGTAGVTTTDFSDFGQNAYAKDMALDPQGNILVGGFCYGSNPSAGRSFAAAAYDSNGYPIMSFGINGHECLRMPGNDSYVSSVGIKADIFGNNNMYLIGKSGNSQFAAIRLAGNGNIDPSFGYNGLVLIAFPYFTPQGAEVMSIDPHGRVILGGVAQRAQNYYGVAITRISANGVIDAGWGGGNGYVIYDLPNTTNVDVQGLAIDAIYRLVFGIIL